MEENNSLDTRKAEKGRHKGTLLIILGLIMILGALGLTAYNI